MENDEYPYRVRRDGYEVLIYESRQLVNSDNINLDVELVFDSGRRYSATFFTLKNIASIFAKNKVTGECGGGLYFQCPDMVIVETMSEEIILKTIEISIAEDRMEFEFKRLSDIDEMEFGDD